MRDFFAFFGFIGLCWFCVELVTTDTDIPPTKQEVMAAAQKEHVEEFIRTMKRKQHMIDEVLPKGAYNVKQVEYKWTVYQWAGGCFLMFRDSNYNSVSNTQVDSFICDNAKEITDTLTPSITVGEY